MQLSYQSFRCPSAVWPLRLTLRLTSVWHGTTMFSRSEGGTFPAKEELKVWYLEAYCRDGSTDRAWEETTIGHTTKLIAASEDRRRLQLECTLADGVVVTHMIRTVDDGVDFRVKAHNPTDKVSRAYWAQPCIRVARFTGASSSNVGASDATDVHPRYIHNCFVFLENKLTRMPTSPWSTNARYTPGQVWVAPDVDRNDVNPRPLSRLVPSNGLIGCFSKDETAIMATAWDPYQELFQGIITCLHSDFRIGGLLPGESKTIHGKIYLVENNVEKLLVHYRRDFPNR